MFENIVEELQESGNQDPELMLAVIADMSNYIKQLEGQLVGAREQEELWKQYACKLEQQFTKEETQRKSVSVFNGIDEFARDTVYPKKD